MESVTLYDALIFLCSRILEKRSTNTCPLSCQRFTRIGQFLVPSIRSLSSVIYAAEGGAAISGEDKKRVGGELEVYLKNASVLFLRSPAIFLQPGGIHFVAGRFLWPIQRDRDSVPVVNIPTLDVFVSPSRKLPFSCTPN